MTSYVLYIGMDWSGGGMPAVNARLRSRVHREVAAWYLAQGHPEELADRAASLAVEDKASRLGTTLVLLTEAHLSHYLFQAQEIIK